MALAENGLSALRCPLPRVASRDRSSITSGQEQGRAEQSSADHVESVDHAHTILRRYTLTLARWLQPISSGPFPCVRPLRFGRGLLRARAPKPPHAAPRLLPGVPHCDVTNLPPPELQSSVVDRATKPRSYGVSDSSSGPMIRPASASGWGLDPPHGAFGVSARPNHIQPHTTISLRMVKVTPFTSPQKTSGYACSASGEDPMGFLFLNWLQAMPPSPFHPSIHPSSPASASQRVHQP